MSMFTVRMLEKQWPCSAYRLLRALCLVGHIWADTSLTTSPSKTFFLGFTWTAPNLDCSLWERTADWFVHFVSYCLILRAIFSAYNLSLQLWNWIIGGVWPGKQWRAQARHLKLWAHWTKCCTNVHDVVSSPHTRAVSSHYFRPIQDEAL